MTVEEIYIFDDYPYFFEPHTDSVVFVWTTPKPNEPERYESYKYKTYIDRNFFKEQGFLENREKLKDYLLAQKEQIK